MNKAWADALRLHNHCDGRTAQSNIFSSPVRYYQIRSAFQSVTIASRYLLQNPTDCRGELASSEDKGRLPIENTIGLPLANPPPPRDHELKSSKRFFRKLRINIPYSHSHHVCMSRITRILFRDLFTLLGFMSLHASRVFLKTIVDIGFIRCNIRAYTYVKFISTAN